MKEEDDERNDLLTNIHSEHGFDFRGYRASTLTRRLGRRLRARGVRTYAAYAGVLDQDPHEYEKLFDDMTISVTSFFRDDLAFEVLQTTVLPALLGPETTTPETGLRVWSAGCATGQEPYSLAMLFLESRTQGSGQPNVTILATDIDGKALARARDGVFTPTELEGIRPEWLGKYFVPERSGQRVHPAVRQLVEFEAHNLVSDPPYSDMDLILCRNVLIYFTPPLQTRVLHTFDAALKSDGFLLLGKAEIPTGETGKTFRCLDRKAKLYRKQEPGSVRGCL